MKHATYEDGAWKTEVVEPAAANGLSLVADVEVVNTAFQPGSNTSLALRNGTPEIVYTQRENNIYFRVYHAARVDAMNWDKAEVTSSYMYDTTNPFLVDATGGRHIFPATYDGLLHMQGTPGSWTKEPITTSSIATSAALDAKGVSHVAYLDIGAQRMSYASHATGSFQTTEVDPTSFATGGSLKVDDTGRVHIAHHDLSAKRLMYATACP
ncbi:hypothetical protein [Polyangium sorediatum]|uniref:hypothetical protein n=1 Tax=Polyangium sorediatum TaxID=889274 RepID=UPI0010BD0A53|nr:hypothetical protein [Polyangium sorediatum]